MVTTSGATRSFSQLFGQSVTLILTRNGGRGLPRRLGTLQLVTNTLGTGPKGVVTSYQSHKAPVACYNIAMEAPSWLKHDVRWLIAWFQLLRVIF